MRCPAIIEYRDRGCVLRPPPSHELVHEMMSFLACGEVADDVVPMFLEDLHLDGADAGAITWGDEIPADVRDDAHVIVIGCGEAGLLAGIRLAQAGLPFTIIEKNGGPGGTWWENRYPGARVDIGSHFYCYSFEPADHWTEYFSQHPELRDYFERVMSKYGVERALPVRHRGRRRPRSTTPPVAGRSTVTNPDGTTEVLDARAVDQRGRRAQHTPDARHPGHGRRSRGRRSTRRGGTPPSTIRGTRFALDRRRRQRLPDRADDRRRGRAAHRVSSAPRSGCSRTRTTTGACPTASGGRCGTCRSTDGGSASSPSIPGAGLSIERSRIDPDYDDGGLAISASNRATRELFAELDRAQLGGDAELEAKAIPDYPATAKRMLQDNGSWLACLRKDNVELVRTGIERIVADGVITVDGTFRPADVICYATGFRHNDFLWPMTSPAATARSCASSGATSRRRTSASRCRTSRTSSACTGPGTNLAHGASLIFQSECQVDYVMNALRELLTSGSRTLEPRPEVQDEYADRYQSEISQMVWAHESVKHSHFKNPNGKIFTISPWPIPTYWTWTKTFEPKDYVWS